MRKRQLRLVRLLIEGDVGSLAPELEGWTMSYGEIVSPEGDSITPGRMRGSRYWPALRAELKRLRSMPAQYLLPFHYAINQAMDADSAASAATAAAPCNCPRRRD